MKLAAAKFDLGLVELKGLGVVSADSVALTLAMAFERGADDR